MNIYKRNILDQEKNIYEVWYGTEKTCAIIIINEKTKEILDIDNPEEREVSIPVLQNIAEKYVETLK